MGILSYAGSEHHFDDRLLHHLQVVITTKLRRRETFALIWQPVEGAGREAVWIDNGVPIRFRYDKAAPPQLNRDWLEALMEGTHRPGGLTVMPEPQPEG